MQSRCSEASSRHIRQNQSFLRETPSSVLTGCLKFSSALKYFLPIFFFSNQIFFSSSFSIKEIPFFFYSFLLSIDFTFIFQHPVWKQFVDFCVGVSGLLHGEGQPHRQLRVGKTQKRGLKARRTCVQGAKDNFRNSNYLHLALLGK